MKVPKIVLTNFINKRYLEMLPDFKEKKTQAFITISLSLIAVAFLGLFAINPTLSTIADLQKQTSDSDFVNQKLDEKIQNLSVLQKEYALLQNDLPVVFSAIPQNPTTLLLLGEMQTIAKNHNINIVRIQTFKVEVSRPKETNQKYFSFTFSLEGEGQNQDMIAFGKTLSHFSRMVNITSINVTKPQELGKVPTISIRGNAFFKL